jgi:hypothetical protein
MWGTVIIFGCCKPVFFAIGINRLTACAAGFNVGVHYTGTGGGIVIFHPAKINNLP